MIIYAMDECDGRTNFLCIHHMIFGNYKEDVQKLFLQVISSEKTYLSNMIQLQILH